MLVTNFPSLRLNLESVDGVPPCESVSDCSRMLWTKFADIDNDHARCLVQTNHMRANLDAINKTYEDDLNERHHKVKEIEDWITTMRDQNQMMVHQV